ncbi:hypothetical protein AJ80_02859 [Polytolypa hystricis UAMH7299]|uniref:C2H2-type domain-containing protein n=1 Tax=Polytolypa hystricis (strain UAMH7299) TaxID=1447883 RepID=A0A2B7YP51_POLH7|nr:hypothetical protein AJ80_02859 [Polytolypa hystricis UAMH7299]
MSTKTKSSRPKLAIPGKSIKMNSHFQTKRSSQGQDFSQLSTTISQDGDYSPLDRFSLSSSIYGSSNPHDMNSWSLHDAVLMSSASSCTSETTEESFETNSGAKRESEVQDSQLFPFPSFSHQLASQPTGQVTSLDHSGNYSSLSELQNAQDTTDAGTSPQLAYNQPQGFQNFSSMLAFPFENECQSNGEFSHVADETQSIGLDSKDLTDTDMFTSSNWDHISTGTDEFANGSSSHFSSLFSQLPVTPPLTESGNDTTTSCSMAGYPSFAAKEGSPFIDMSASLSNQTFTIGDPFCPVTPPLNEQDPNRTIRASKQSQRPLLSAATARPEKADVDPYQLPIGLNQQPKDAQENRSPRDHPYYSLPTRSDGKYYCPFGESDKPCSHPPTTQKCAYHKYLDSHLKPYRCKVAQCIDAHFSSNACLFRHEREAHGMHGHGENPHLCHFPSCERSIPGNGFPRRWNLHDHMKRVHDYTSSDKVSSPEQLPVGAQNSKKKENPPRKRKGASNATTMKRVRSTQSSQTNGTKLALTLAQQGQQLQNAERNYYNCLARLQEDLKQLNPRDAVLHDKANASLQELHTLGLNYRAVRASQAATERASGISR